jgi:hypothetical protein
MFHFETCQFRTAEWGQYSCFVFGRPVLKFRSADRLSWMTSVVVFPSRLQKIVGYLKTSSSTMVVPSHFMAMYFLYLLTFLISLQETATSKTRKWWCLCARPIVGTRDPRQGRLAARWITWSAGASLLPHPKAALQRRTVSSRRRIVDWPSCTFISDTKLLLTNIINITDCCTHVLLSCLLAKCGLKFHHSMSSHAFCKQPFSLIHSYLIAAFEGHSEITTFPYGHPTTLPVRLRSRMWAGISQSV